MADENKTVLSDTGELIIDFREICRFCLSETKNGVSINDKCLWEESKGSKPETVYDFMTKISFIKMNSSSSFPLQVCENCFKLVQLCHNFSQICQKSDYMLRTCYENSLKESEGQSKTSVKDLACKEFLIFGDEVLPRTINNFSNVLDEITKIKKSYSEQKLRDSVAIVETYKQKLILLSEKIKGARAELSRFSSNDKLNLPLEGEQSLHASSLCSLRFGSTKALNFHYTATHNQRSFKSSVKFQCKNCLKSFYSQEKLRRHYKVIHKVSVSPDDFLSSIKQLVTLDKRKFFCFHCDPCREFQSQEQLSEHVENNHGNKPREVVSKFYSCVHCNYSTFPTRVGLNQHLSLVHKLGEGDTAWNDLTIECAKPSKAFLCLTPKASSQGEKQSQNLTELSAFLDILDSVLDSLNVIQGETGFKILCKNCNPQPQFTSVNDFVTHIQTHSGESKTLENWETDGKATKKEATWDCSKCPASYSRKQSLYCHLKEKHKHNGGATCPDCPERFATNRQLIQHGISVHQKYFAYFHNVYRKILQPGSEGEEENKIKNFECDICQKKYLYKTSLKKHILAAHLGRSSGDAVVCSYCGKTLTSKLNLKSHIEFVHEALFVSCPVCKKRINFRTIGKHYKTHKNSDVVHSKNSFLCNLCGKVLKSKRSFEDHQKLHKNIRDELCDVCGSGFTTKKCLRLHKKTHEGLQRKVFGCDQCDKVFSGRHTLNRHLLTHSGKKNFVCEICSKCFYTLQELNRHVRYHKKEYRFDCQLCDMRFLDKSRFRHHMMRHRNVRPHKCQFCEKMFIVRGKMNLHMAAKHNVEVQNTKGVWKDPKTYVPLDDLL